MAWTAAVGGVLFLLFYVGATGYWIFRDDILAASIARQSRMRIAYEDRIADLRSQIDRVTSRQLLDQEQIDAKLQKVLGRQAALDARQDLLAGLDAIARKVGVSLTDPRTTGSVLPASTDSTSGDAAGVPSDSVSVNEAPLRESRLTDEPAPAASGDPDSKLGAIEFSLDQMERQQTELVRAVAANVAAKAGRINTVIAKLGHKVDAPTVQGGVGGPFVPLPDAPRSFRQGVAAVTNSLETLVALREAASQLPLWRPLPAADITSGFGTRMDPFLNRPSLHAGVDFRSTEGAAVRATAIGTVTEAGPTGGYGNMVEIDHGNGITTRYAHLSAIAVKAGDKIETGDVVGYVGTTGRSTGPHLHYEVRVDGEPIDPMRYIRAGGELRGIL